MSDLLLYISNTLALRSFSRSLSKFLNVKVLNAKTVLKIYYKLSLVYLSIKEVAAMATKL